MHRLRLAVTLAVLSIALVVLAASLRPDAFFVGDPGVKLIAARNAVRFPTHPFDIPLPRVAGESTPLVDPFFSVHGDHAHAITTEVFPLMSAPLLAAFGIRGVYIWPALGFIATLAACASLGGTLDRRRDPALVAIVTALGTPFLFYGLEFWEHTLALAAGVAGAALFVRGVRLPPSRYPSADRQSPGDGGQPDHGTMRAFASGLLFGVAILLRPEAACFAVAVAVASFALPHRLSWTMLAAAAAGVVIPLIPIELHTLLHFGTLVPPHVGSQESLEWSRWPLERLTFATAWLLPSRWSSAGPLNPANLWTVAPAAIVALAALVRPPARDGQRFLWIVFGVDVLLVLLTAPNSGGGQWGPRYLLFAYVPLALLAADVVASLPTRRWWAVVTLVVLLVAGLWVQRAAYRQLRSAKATYGRIVDFVASVTPPGTNIVTDVWWLDQLAASVMDRRTLFFAPDEGYGRGLVNQFSGKTVPTITVIRSRDESPSLGSWSDASCYFEEARDELPVRGLVAIRLRHRCGYKP